MHQLIFIIKTLNSLKIDSLLHCYDIDTQPTQKEAWYSDERLHKGFSSLHCNYELKAPLLKS